LRQTALLEKCGKTLKKDCLLRWAQMIDATLQKGFAALFQKCFAALF
jgi:hypothetical protein